MMRYLLPLACLCISLSIKAQTSIDTTISLFGVNQIFCNLEWGDVEFKTWNEKSVRITGEISVNLGENDDAFKWSAAIENNQLIVYADIPDMDDLPEFTTVHKDGKDIIFRPGSDEAEYWKSTRNGAYSWVSKGVQVDVKLEIYLPVDASLKVRSTYGDVVISECQGSLDIENTYGHIIAVMPSSGWKEDCELISTYSFVDASVPQGMDQNIDLETEHGHIYSDVDFVLDKERSRQEIFHTGIKGKINNGGSALSIKSPYSNIYLRKR